ncbi:hypothetical protein [Photobacterium kishitanii]|uniref:Acyl carrier protein n=1 Tax=Photobacterium kishitanii TaxID=318456 RepID=A0A2T3KMN4_9GAMM|nr:hypothetical protein [Photobacterium kishitanii]PSV01044.1 hypothetical protein C9J27_03170 [Photobacterium kishitanii]
MTGQNNTQCLKNIIANFLNINMSDIEEDRSIRRSLTLTEFDCMSLFCHIENKLKIEFDDELDTNGNITINELEQICSLLRKKQ